MSLLEFSKKVSEIGDSSPASRYRKWFHQNAKLFTQVDEKESERVALRLKAIPKQCYTNCTRAILGRSDYRYFEGYVEFYGVPIDHAFLVKDGKVVDPTLGIPHRIKQKHAKENYGLDLKEKRSDQFGKEYFGVEIPQDDVIRLACRDNFFTTTSFEYWMERQ